jgi:hypothetical protein
MMHLRTRRSPQARFVSIADNAVFVFMSSIFTGRHFVSGTTALSRAHASVRINSETPNKIVRENFIMGIEKVKG